MLDSLPIIFDHSCHTLHVDDLKDRLDVLIFEGEEHLSKPFTYRIEFTCIQQDLTAEQFLGVAAHFSLHPAVHTLPKALPGFPVPKVVPFRTLHGVITGLQRLSGSNDEVRYEVILQPRLILLDRGRQYRIYQDKSVPQIVEHILRSRHGFMGQHFIFTLSREYPRREQVMQYGESDLAFINRLLAEVGIWYRFTSDDRLSIDVVQFHDDQRQYQQGVKLAQHPQSGFASVEDSVWALQTRHQVVEKNIHFRSYDHLNVRTWLKGEVDHTRGARTTYGEAYHYAEPYTSLGDPLALDEKVLSESGFFYARLRHERYLNEQTRLSGISSSATLAPGQVLNILDEAPKAFAPGAVLVRLSTRAARDSSLTAHFEAIPYSETVCFRPALLDKPKMAGTVPARVTSTQDNDPYGHIDLEGRYKVNFLFDRDEWPMGKESMWLRMARPYAGDTHGLHLPLIQGTEVAVAFERGDPDKPYIAHALHDSQHVDHVTMRNYKRNVLRTPANSKLRMDDTRGEEHIKLSTEHGGKSQLNLGHLVDAQKQQRGEGFELRTDSWGAIRAGNGLFISADEQTKAGGEQLDMSAAIEQLESALSLARSLAEAARGAQARPGDIDGQKRLSKALKNLVQPGVLLHAPAGIGIVSPEGICLSSGAESVGIMAAHNTDISTGHDFTAMAEQAVSVLAQKGDMQLKAAQGKIELHAQDSNLHALARTDIKIESVQGRVEISAPEELVLNCGGAYIRLKGGEIELGCPGNIYVKAAHIQKQGSASLNAPQTPLPSGYSGTYTLKEAGQEPQPFSRYRITTEEGEIFNGVTDRYGKTMSVHTLMPGGMKIEFPDAAVYDEQLRLMTPSGEAVSNLKYQASLADGSLVEGVTDEQGYTQRLETREPVQVTRLKILPPEDAGVFCCAALNVQDPLEIDLSTSNIATSDTGVGESVRDVSLPEGKKRKLTAGEIAMARTVFKDAIDYAKVKIHHGGWWLFFGAQNTASTPNGEMYYPPSTGYYRDDFSGTGKARDKALFMHEMTHVWQYQLGYLVKMAGLTVTIRGASAYEYELKKGARLSDYNMEQQGEIISDYYVICVLEEPGGVWDRRNSKNSPELLALTLESFLNSPADKNNLPG